MPSRHALTAHPHLNIASATPLLTRQQAAERLNVSESTLDRLIRSGDITAIKFSRRLVRVDPASVEANIAQRRIQPRSASAGRAA